MKGEVKEIDIGEFAIAFVRRFREHDKVHEGFKPSMRQSIAISRLLSARCMKKYHLTRTDFIEAAVVTSHPDIKGHVEKIARETLSDLGGPRIDRELALKLAKPFGFKTPDEEILKLWFKHRDELTERQKNILKKRAKRSLAKVGLLYARALLHDYYEAGAGPIKGYITRPYRTGADDPSLIDFESTIENAIARGIEINNLTYEDFITRQVRKKRRSVLYLQDASASFRYGVLLNCAVCGSMLIYGLPRDDQVAIALFSDDVHPIKGFFSKEDEMALIERLLSIEPIGGTNAAEALTWAREQFEKIGRNFVKFCLVFSDMGFKQENVEQALEEITKLQNMEAKISFLKFEPFRYHFQDGIRMLDESGCEMIDVEKIWDFPELVSRIISPY